MEGTKWDRLGFCVIEKLGLGDRVDGVSDPGRNVDPVPATIGGAVGSAIGKCSVGE